MLRCRLIDLFYTILPLKIWRDFLIRGHTERCPYCQAELASREAAESLMMTESKVSLGASLWPQVKAGLVSFKDDRAQAKPLLAQKRWRWAAAAAGLFVAGLASFWLLKGYQTQDTANGGKAPDRFSINYINVEDKPAQAYLYQPSESDLIIIWVQKSP
jgi:anti-sigma factor RsiW